MTVIQWVAQVALGLPFAWLGWEAIVDPGHRVAQAARLHMPRPKEAVRLNGAVMVLAGVALAANVFPRIASVVLIASLIPTTLAGHAFWLESDPKARHGQLIQVLKNLGLIGGLAFIAAQT